MQCRRLTQIPTHKQLHCHAKKVSHSDTCLRESVLWQFPGTCLYEYATETGRTKRDKGPSCRQPLNKENKAGFPHFFASVDSNRNGGKQDQPTKKEVDYIQTEDENGNTTIYFGMIPFRF